jgi:hypothetical protein
VTVDVMKLLHRVNPYDGFVPFPDFQQIVSWNLGSDSDLFGKLVALTHPQLAVECGTWLGGSALNTARNIKALGESGRLLCIDSWQGPYVFWDQEYCPVGYDKLRLVHGWPQVYYDFLSNVVISDMQDVIIPFPQSVEVACQLLVKYGVKSEMIYIDASHEEREVARDIHDYLQLLAPGGVIFGDDYYYRDTEVGKAVHKMFTSGVWTYPDEGNPARFWGFGARPEGAHNA